MRRFISFSIALTMFCVGTAGFIYLLAFAPRWTGLTVMTAAFIGALGGLWLYSDFIDATPNEQILKGELIPPSQKTGLPTRPERRN